MTQYALTSRYNTNAFSGIVNACTTVFLSMALFRNGPVKSEPVSFVISSLELDDDGFSIFFDRHTH